MVMKGTQLKVSDNTGALIANCIEVKKRSVGHPGTLLRVSIRKAEPNSKVKKGTKHLAVVIRTKAKYLRKDGTYICFNENACVLVNENKEPKGTHVFGSVMKEVKQKGFIKVGQQAAEII